MLSDSVLVACLADVSIIERISWQVSACSRASIGSRSQCLQGFQLDSPYTCVCVPGVEGPSFCERSNGLTIGTDVDLNTLTTLFHTEVSYR